jgi:hypothetical protein
LDAFRSKIFPGDGIPGVNETRTSCSRSFEISVAEDFWCRTSLALTKKRRKRTLQERDAGRTKSGYSMIPFREKKAIFIHIPKSAGMSVSKALFGGKSGGHATAKEYVGFYGREKYASYFSFSFVRNPWDRLVSAYFYLKEGGSSKTDRRYRDNILNKFEDFNSFVESWITKDSIQNIMHLRPQKDYLTIFGNDVKVNYVGKFETLEEDFKKIANRIGVDVELPRINVNQSRDEDYRQYYNENSIEVVSRVYKKDIEMFGYKF